jgi:hypothetical protein
VRENHAEHKGGTNFNVATDVWNELMRVRKKTKLEKYWPTIPEDVREILVDDVRVRQHFLELRMPVPKEVRFQGELAQMHSLGLRDHAMNVRALRQFGGDLEMACQEVRRNQWNIRGRDCGNGILSYRITATSVANGVVSRELTEYTLASQQFSRLGQQHPTMIDVYENPTLKTRYDATRRSFAASGKPAEEVFVFHGTASANVELIMKTGFRVGGRDIAAANGSAYGIGVYTATGPNTPVNYAQGSRQVILSYALTGNVGSAANGGDSWRPRGDWHIFRHGNQLLPKWVVHF